MANRMYLMFHSHDRPTTAELAEDACLLAANYLVPVLWIALFDSSDLTYVDVLCTDAEDKDVLESIPTLFTSYAKAHATYAARQAGLAAALGTEHASVLSEWEKFLYSQGQESNLQLDLIELWMLYGDASAVSSEVQEWLEGMRYQSGHGWRKLCDQASLDDPRVSKYGLRGYAWNTEYPLD